MIVNRKTYKEQVAIRFGGQTILDKILQAEALHFARSNFNG